MLQPDLDGSGSRQPDGRLRLREDSGCRDAKGKPLGVITDRDIACRIVAQGKAPDTPVQEAMTTPAITVSPDDSVEDC